MPGDKQRSSETGASRPPKQDDTGTANPVDQEAQKDAAEERKEEGGYD